MNGRHYFPDEEPEVDDIDEDLWGAGHCERCGLHGHAGVDCHIVTDDILLEFDATHRHRRNG